MKYLNYTFLLLLASALPLLTLLHPGLPITHDGQDHVARIANFYASLSEGNIIPRWAGNLNWGYGHPILMFLYPLPSYFASIFHLFGLSLVDSVKAVFGVSYILSALFMFFWLRNFLGKFPALIGAIIYIYAPYRFVDLYVRGAIGEHVAFIFMPAVCYFLLMLNKEKKLRFLYLSGLVLSSGGLILSHNAISLMFFPFAAFYTIFLFWVYKSKFRLIYSIIGILYGFLISAFFWVPAFMEGKYTLRDIVTENEALTRFVNLNELIYGAWSFGGTGVFSVQLGIIQWAFILLLPLAFYFLQKRRREERNNIILLAFVLLFFLSSIFIMLHLSKPVWEIITTLQKFQFPWRFLSVSVFFVSILAAFVVYSIPNQKIQRLTFFLVLVVSVFLTKDYWKAQGFNYKPESFFTNIYESTTDTGESAPIWSIRFMEKKPKDTIEVIGGNAEIEKISRNSTSRSYNINSGENSTIRENTLYFPGWKVFIDGEESSVEFQDPNNRGLMTFVLPQGSHRVDVKFEDTKLRALVDIASFLSVLGLGILGVVINKKWLKN
ncbi:MAG: hypothetical protein ACD_37C00097G0005 [uncultured bacterium]|nr:MAG: hypothetical protein ACD_37C00097G0005 [uncultured bacterium]